MLNQQQKVKLQDIPAFARLSPNIVRQLEFSSYIYRLDADQYLYRQGEIARAIYVVYSGGVRLVEHTSGTQDVQLKLYGEGDVFGLLAISGEYPYPASIQALSKSVIVGVPGSSARTLMLEYPELALVMIDLLVEHVHHSHSRIRQFASERVERRLARALLHYADKFGIICEGVISINVDLSQKDLAEFIGTTIETVNRTLKVWEQRQYIQLSRQHINLIDRLALMAVAEEKLYMGQQL
jgi:CRP-like cAMP-binding protein